MQPRRQIASDVTAAVEDPSSEMKEPHQQGKKKKTKKSAIREE